MGRPRIHEIDPDELLQRIYQTIGETVGGLVAALDAHRELIGRARAELAKMEAKRPKRYFINGQEKNNMLWRHPKEDELQSRARHLECELRRGEEVLAELNRSGFRYDLQKFSGREDLSDSAKTVYRAAIRELEARGLLRIAGAKATRVFRTQAGFEHLKKMETANV